MIRPVISTICLLLLTTALPAAEPNVDLPRYPSISPDGSQVVFSWRGDLWKVSSGGGVAQRLTSHPQNDLQSAWSRDGSRIAFASTRSGALNIWLMNADGTGVRQVIELDRPLGLVAFGTDERANEVITVSARIEHDAYPGPRPYMIWPAGGELRRVHDAFGTFAVVSPDGKRVLFNRGGANWLRRHYRGSDSRDVWLYDRADRSFTRLTAWPGNDGRARWIDNTSYVYASDRQDDCSNLYRRTLGDREDQARRLTFFKDTDVEDFDVSADGKTLVFAMWDKLYTLDLSAGDARVVALGIRASEDEADRFINKDIGKSVSEARLSPDGKTMALVAYGELYVRAVEKNSPTRRVTQTHARERDIAFGADGTRLYFCSDIDGNEAIYEATVRQTRSDLKKQYNAATKTPATTQATSAPTTDESESPTTAPSTPPTTRSADEESRWADAVTFQVTPVVSSDEGDRRPSPSPDGRLLAFQRGNGKLMVMDLASQQVRTVLDGWSDSLDWRWSPDGRHLAYVTEDQNNNADIWIVRADGTEPAVNITRHPDNDHSPRSSADGKILAFLSDRSNNEYDVWMVWLDKQMESLGAAELDQYFKDASAAAKKRKPPSSTQPSTQPATAPAAREPDEQNPDLDDAYLRVRRVTSLAGNESDLELLPGGEKYVFVATIGTTKALWSLERDAAEPKKLAAAVKLQQVSLSGEQIVFVESGRAGMIKIPGGETEYCDIADKIRIDLQQQSSQKFLEAARIVGAQYYDPKMGGLDWLALVKRYHELARAARTSDEFDHAANKLVGELNGSHLGINSPDPPNPQARSFGRLGIAAQRVESGYKVTSILPDGPADKAAMKLRVDDVIVAVDGQPFDATDTLDAKLAGKVDRETLIAIDRGGRRVELLLVPAGYGKIADLAYEHWRRQNARKVDEWSGGKLGYIHIEGMDQGSLDVFERDLYAAAFGRKGLIIDVRNNGGGWTTDRLLASIMYPRHAYTVPRGLDPKITDGYPQDRLFIQRYTGPVNMLCNEKSYSNAEIISHAFLTLKRGTLVGQRTAGGVISTGGTTLIDGTAVRIPFRGWFLPDGTNMENHGATPDILVPQTPDDEAAGQDSQLKAAVEDLLKRIE